MLVELRVSNLALIEDLSFHFSAGLNVLSGETGAGKSVVIGALNLLLGERASVEQVRQGRERAIVEGMVSCAGPALAIVDKILAEASIEPADELILAREVSSSGRSVARVNGRSVPAALLKELGRVLFDLHGQHQHQSLLRPERHLELLDAFAGEAVITLRQDLADLCRKREKRLEMLLKLGSSGAERERRLEYARFQLAEIREAAPLEGEDGDLSRREKILANAERLSGLIHSAYRALYGDEEGGSEGAAFDEIGLALKDLEEAALIDPSLETFATELSGLTAQLSEICRELGSYRANFQFDSTELESIQLRQNLLNGLKKKYGPSLDEVFSYAHDLEKEIVSLENSAVEAESLQGEITELEDEYTHLSRELGKMRRETASRLEDMLQSILAELALPGALFHVNFLAVEGFSPRGRDKVEFMFSANRGEELKPLARIISGGEVSRLMLALKSVLAKEDPVSTLVFDEIDSGVGGATIQAVAEKLVRLASCHQLMCVTHSPHIAAMADSHFQVYKEISGERTLTRAMLLSEEERRQELARMLDGAAVDEVALLHVDSMLKRAQQFKEKDEV